MVNTKTTPLFADAKKTLKKGQVVQGTEFEVEEVYPKGVPAVEQLGKTDTVDYLDQHADLPKNGDGWIEFKNCVSVPYDLPDTPPPSTLPKRRFLLTVEELPAE
jgi:hypothetical protein